MRKFFYLIFAFSLISLLNAQVNIVTEAPMTNGSTTQLRAPNGLASSAYMRACALVLQSELTFIPSGSTLTSFGFTLQNTSSISAPVTGNFTVFLENTSDVSYLKGTTWATIITPMTQVYASVMTIPVSTGATSVVVTLSTPFVYTGGGLYVGYDWFCSGPYSTTNPATYWSESLALTVGCASGISTSGAPTLATSNFRPSFLFGFQNPYSNDAKVMGIEAPGRIPAVLNAPHTIRALIRNQSNTPLSNISVTVNVNGANTFNNVQVIPSLAAGASAFVNFAAFNPQAPGQQTVVVSLPGDQFSANNTMSWVQNVTCNTWGLNPAVGTFTNNSVGFALGSGVLSTPYSNSVPSTLIGMRGAISTNTPAVGNNVYGVLISAGGIIMATSNTINITSAMLGNFVNFSFSSPVALTANTTYYLGFAQTAATNAIAYYPAGTNYQTYIQPALYYVSALTGGVPGALTQNFGFFGLEGVFAHTVTISAPAQTVSCGSSATLNAISSTNYSWSTGATTSSIVIPTATANTVYTITATNTLGCLASGNASLFVTPIPITISQSPSVVCAGNTLTLTASGAANYTWTTQSGSSNNSSFNHTPSGNTTYSLNAQDPLTGCSANTVISVAVNPLPIVNIVYSAATICVNNTVQLTAGGTAATHTWSTGQQTTTIIETPAASTVYIVSGTSALGCVNQNSINITVNTFSPGITSPTAICLGQSIQLSATGASTVLWNTGSIFATIGVTPAVTTSYTVTGKSTANTCTGTAVTTVSVNPVPLVIAAASRTSICKGEKSVLTASGAATYSWSNGDATVSTTIIPNSTLPLTMTVTGTDALGCSKDATIAIKVNACTGVTETENSGGFAVFPNPGSGLFTLRFADGSRGTVTVINVVGQVLYTGNLAEAHKIDLGTAPAGLYLFTLELESGSNKTLRVVKN